MRSTEKVCVILSAGGIGSRMKSVTPKQFLLLNGKAIARHSFDLFASMKEVSEIVVVCDQSYQYLFNAHGSHAKVTFANPGERRQDSVYNGLQAITSEPAFVCVHDSARPFINEAMVQRIIDAAREHGAATAGMPIKFTVKESHPHGLVARTPDRTHIWEIQTPQIIRYEMLKKGFALAHEQSLTVTDDVSLIEQLGLPVQLVTGCYRNLKITTPEDLLIAQAFLNNP